jgi:hypothetical protein
MSPMVRKLTMRFKPLKRLDLILSLSKDEDTFSGFFSILLGGVIEPALADAAGISVSGKASLFRSRIGPEHLKIANQFSAIPAHGFRLLQRRERLVDFRSAGSEEEREFALRHVEAEPGRAALRPRRLKLNR